MTKLTKISIILFIITFLFQLVVSNQTTIKTQELNNLTARVEKLKNKISLINQDIYLTSSISNMETRAKAAGFTPMEVPLQELTHPTIASTL